MSRLLRRLLLAGIAAASLGALGPATLPSPARAASVDLAVHGSNGYRVRIEGRARRVRLAVRGPAGTATYSVRGRATQRGVHASFGKLGLVDVAFRPSGRARIETPPRRCEGKPRAIRWGMFVGTIRFRGERGYTRVRVRRAGGSTSTFSRWRCKGRRAGRARAAAEDPLPVVWEIADPRRGLEAGAAAFELGDGESLFMYFASQEERRGRMRIERFFFELGEVEGFAYDESLRKATISLPFPFAGRATFERGVKGRTSWTGSLSVLLPGTARISLVGRRFHARLYRLTKDGIAKPGA